MPFGKHDVSQKGKKGGKEDQWHPTDEKAKRALTEYEASIKIGKFFRVKERLRVIARKKKTTARMVRKIFFYLFFVMVTLRANLELSNPQEYNLVQRLRGNFYHDSEIGEQAMEEVVTIANFWEWIETRFIPQYYSTVTFDGEDQPRLKNDIFAYNRKVGGVRFGQVRLKKKPCSFDNANMELGNTSFFCYGDKTKSYYFSTSEEDKSPFGYFDGIMKEDIIAASKSSNGSTTTDPSKLLNLTKKISFTWEGWNETGIINGTTTTEREQLFSSDSSLYSLGASLPSPAYSITLPQNDVELATHLLTVMKNNSYVDEQTACLFVDFSLFNPMVDRFLSVRLAFVTQPWGGFNPKGIFKAVYTNPVNFLRKSPVNIADPIKMVHGITYIIELMIYVVYIMEEISKMIAMGMTYYNEFTSDLGFHWMTILLYILMNILNFSAYTNLPGGIGGGAKLNPTTDQFLYLRDYYQSVDYGRVIAGFIIFLVMIRLTFLFSKAAPSFALILNTLESSVYKLSNFLVILIFLLCGFAFIAMVYFGQQVKGFETLIDAMASLFKALLGDIDLEALQDVDWMLATVFYFFYMLIMNVVILNISIAILSDAYAEQNDIIANAEDVKISKEMKKFVLIKIWQTPCIGPYLQRVYLYGFEGFLGENYRKQKKQRKAAKKLEKLQEERHAIKKRPLLSSLKERDEKDKALLITKAGVQQTLKELRKMHKQFESMTHMVKDNIDHINAMAGDGKTEIDAFLFTHGHGDLDKKLEAEKKKKLTAAKKKNDEGAVINIGETKKKDKNKKICSCSR
jgi:hypothetical protein